MKETNYCIRYTTIDLFNYLHCTYINVFGNINIFKHLFKIIMNVYAELVLYCLQLLSQMDGRSSTTCVHTHTYIHVFWHSLCAEVSDKLHRHCFTATLVLRSCGDISSTTVVPIHIGINHSWLIKQLDEDEDSGPCSPELVLEFTSLTL